jgi:hypothetical protein
VTVCPTQAIVAGDLEDPSSRIAQMTGRIPLQVRKPEKGTRPKVFYVEADAAALTPTAAPPASDYMWAQAPQVLGLSGMPAPDAAGAPRRTYAVREQHRNSWGWKVSAYLWTKSLAAGAFLVPAVVVSGLPWREPVPNGALLMALLALATTGALLVADLRQPARFLWTLTRPQWRSWLTRGSYVIAAYGLALTTLFLLGLARRPVPPILNGLTALLAAGTATYTAMLFGQAKGRDLWQSALLGPHLLVQALTSGAALFAPSWLLFLLPLNGLLVAGEVWGRHATEDARLAARLIQDDVRFTTGVLVLGHLLPLSILWGPSSGLRLLAAPLTLFGLFVWEHLYVQAPQRIPLA